MTQAESQGWLDRLQAYSLAEWQPLFNFIPRMEATEQPRGNDLDELLWDFVRTSSTNPNIIIVFDWSNWAESKTVLLSDQPTFDQYDLLTLCMFITTIVRADRFSEGFLASCYRKGIIVSLLKWLKIRVEASKSS